MYQKNEKCVICNSELDEKYADGIWDLAGEVCSLFGTNGDNKQDSVYYVVRQYIEKQNYCCNCGVSR